jgi:ankyrin repeat protein
MVHGAMKQTPLLLAAKWRTEEFVIPLLSLTNIDVNKPDIHGRTPLHHAVMENKIENVKALIEIPSLNLFFKDMDQHTALDFA